MGEFYEPAGRSHKIMISKIIKIKGFLSLIIITAFCMSTMGAVVSDNDGAAFITKAEFDSLKHDFQAQIDRYNSSIDNKIDGAIAGYLDGIKVDKTTELNLAHSFVMSIWFYPYPNWAIGLSKSTYGTNTSTVFYCRDINSVGAVWSIFSGGFWGASWTNAYPYNTMDEVGASSYMVWDMQPLSMEFNFLFGYYVQFSGSSGNLSGRGSGFPIGAGYAYVDSVSSKWRLTETNKGVVKNVGLIYLRESGFQNIAADLQPWMVPCLKMPRWWTMDVPDRAPFLSVSGCHGGWDTYYNYWAYDGYFSLSYNSSYGNRVEYSTWYVYYTSGSYTKRSTISYASVLNTWKLSRQALGIRIDPISATTSRSESYHNTTGYSIQERPLFTNSTNPWIRSAAFVNPQQDFYVGGFLAGDGSTLSYDRTKVLNLCLWSFSSDVYVDLSPTFNSVVTRGPGYESALSKTFSILTSLNNTGLISWSKRNDSDNLTSKKPVRLWTPTPNSILTLDNCCNYLAYKNGVSVRLNDGMPLMSVLNSGTLHLKLSVQVESTSFTYNRSDPMSLGYSIGIGTSCLLHLHVGPFGNVIGNGSTLKLCNSAGDELASYAQSITNISKNGSIFLYDVYIPVKAEDVVYFKLDTTDPYAMQRARLIGAKGTLVEGS